MKFNGARVHSLIRGERKKIISDYTNEVSSYNKAQNYQS